ncbi:MAG: cytochrome C biogenesis protein [Betaproteobacteria bacterium]|nr:cytochrome C biogenesis protein [Betaproteobacteria bacterium]
MALIVLHAMTALLYAVLSLHFWRTRWRTHFSSGAPLTKLALWERTAIAAPLASHSALIYADLIGGPELRFGFGQALSVMMWLGVLIYWIESLFLRLEGMQVPILALAALCSLLPAFFPGLALSPSATQSTEFRIHLVMAMLAYSFFTIAALHALLMTLLERRLHGGALTGIFSALPPLLTMETLLFRLIAAGFALLTLTLVTGAVFSETLFGTALRFNHKTLFALLSWVIFAALLSGRYFHGWRGRTALRWTIAGFVALLLAYVGSRFVLEVILKRSLG